MIGCSSCGRGFYDECELDSCPCEYHSPVAEEDSGRESNPRSDVEESDILYDRSKNYKDTKSTGRKRAALHYPFICGVCEHTKQQHEPKSAGSACTKELCDCTEFMRKPCEWQRLKIAGGGRHPIIGCVDGLQSDRHHGPIKDTMRNELGNVHRICSTCHHRWHAINDNYYEESEYMKIPHKPESATDKELLDNEIAWRSGSMAEKFVLVDEKGLEKYD